MARAKRIQKPVGMVSFHTEEERESICAEARRKAKSEWLSLVISHHAQIENALALVQGSI